MSLSTRPGFRDRDILHGIDTVDGAEPLGVLENPAHQVLDVNERSSAEVMLLGDLSQEALAVGGTEVP